METFKVKVGEVRFFFSFKTLSFNYVSWFLGLKENSDILELQMSI